MNCPECGQPWTLITYTDPIAGNIVTRHRLCPACKLRFETWEQYAKTVEGQAWQASLWHDMVSAESRAKARDILNNHKRGETDE